MRTNDNVWINPNSAVKLFTKYVTSKAQNIEELKLVIKERSFKPTVEAWIASMYLLAMDKLYPDVRHFLQHNPNDPPDFYGLDLFNESGLIHGYIRDIEVFEYVPETTLTLSDEINKKIQKAYSRKTILVCHIRKTLKETVGNLHEMVRSLNPRNEVWIIGGRSDGDSPNLVAQIFPDMNAVTVDVDDVLHSDIQPAFIEGTMGKSTEMVFEPTGKSILLTPEFKMEK